MPALKEIKELARDSRAVKSDLSGSEIVYTYLCEEDDPIILAQDPRVPRLATRHPDYPGYHLASVVCSPIDGLKTKLTLTYKQESLSLRWDSFSLNPWNNERWTWENTGKTEHITSVRSPDLTLHYPAESNVGTAIGTTKDSVEGVDVLRPSVQLKVEKCYAWLSASDVLLLQSMQCTVNGYPWFNYRAGEVLFNGASIEETNENLIKVTFSFTIGLKQPAVNVVLSSGVTQTIDLMPFDYLWYRFAEALETMYDGSKITKRMILDAHVARIYDFSNFALFFLVGPYV